MAVGCPVGPGSPVIGSERGGFTARERSGGDVQTGEKPVRIQQDREAVAELGDRVHVGRVGGRDVLELGVLDGQDLLDVVDDDTGGAGLGLDDDDLGDGGALKLAGRAARPGRTRARSCRGG